eukprot:CAMPEP_0178423046 /NCGR_PEP_ID=MMETSP0689_2-20121128/27489_1 /TAXON_ID=160604 /ORGANISM="Amphidinium massartii, Strain CS-259" /LENGTH=354 /DNA_ID=CAMNT_0020044633 /DNA_START=44 /DNA_END=1105 /DNA_ORIENTATION=+
MTSHRPWLCVGLLFASCSWQARAFLRSTVSSDRGDLPDLVADGDAGSMMRVSADSASAEEAGAQFGMSALLADLASGCLSQQEDAREEMWSALMNRSAAREHPIFLEAASKDASTSSRKPVLWVHLHNFAGTYVCKEAVKQQESAQKTSNCLISHDGCSTVPAQRIHCQQRAQSGKSFTMVEREVDDADFCSELLSGVMFRDPLAGAQSTLRANFFNKDQLMSVLHSGLASRINHQPCLPDWDTYQHFDNFATRSLGGAYGVPPRGVTRQHLDKAKARVASMDVVMILEQLQVQLPQLQATFGWSLGKMTPSSPANAHCDRHASSWTDAEASFLREVNSLDYELYDFAKQVAAN